MAGNSPTEIIIVRCYRFRSNQPENRALSDYFAFIQVEADRIQGLQVLR